MFVLKLFKTLIIPIIEIAVYNTGLQQTDTESPTFSTINPSSLVCMNNCL